MLIGERHAWELHPEYKQFLAAIALKIVDYHQGYCEQVGSSKKYSENSHKTSSEWTCKLINRFKTDIDITWSRRRVQ